MNFGNIDMLQNRIVLFTLTVILLLSANNAFSTPLYWNVFNIEEENIQGSRIVTYGTMADQLNDTNRINVFNPDGGGASENVVGSGSDGSTYWSVFNIENETAQGSRFVTYNSLLDMVSDNNRTGVFNPNGGGASENIVGSASDGIFYWNVFNIEDETTQGSRIVTYSSLFDMISDINRIAVFNPDGGGVAENIVGSGSDGLNYWNVFNIENETAQGARIVTYSSLSDMVTDINRTGVFAPDGGGVPGNVVGSGATIFTSNDTVNVPTPATLLLIAIGIIALVAASKTGAVPFKRALV